MTGTRIQIEHLDGRVLAIPINELVQPGYQKRIPHHGMPLMSNPEKFGDLIIEFEIEYPRTLTSWQKSLIKRALVEPPPEGIERSRNSKA